MKTQFIRVNDIAEVDPSRATVYDLNKRYIDSHGNMFGLRYNRETRKIEIIKIIRTPAKTASYYQQRMVQQKYLARDEGHATAPGVSQPLDNGEGFDESGEAVFDPTAFINRCLEMMKTHRDRLSGIMMNIKNSKVIPETERMDASTLAGIFRNMDIDGIRRIEKVIDNHRELTNYPRSLSYYQSKLDTAGRDLFEALGDDGRRTRFVFFSEMHGSIRHLYRSLLKAVRDLEFFLSEKDVEGMKQLTFAEKQQFQDAMTSIQNTIREITVILRDTNRLEEFIGNPENF
ncbi:MAG: hypothetical protein MUC76_05120 [Spirochaetes bacterium]|jgi:hypothetical protein|nr:hypothetical protein [Spirochaetota bacterium]